MENLGPGQVVGRQALGSSPLGELHVGLSMEASTGLVVDIKEARELKLGSKGVPPGQWQTIFISIIICEPCSLLRESISNGRQELRG
jgi:hypothetical protein